MYNLCSLRPMLADLSIPQVMRHSPVAVLVQVHPKGAERRQVSDEWVHALEAIRAKAIGIIAQMDHGVMFCRRLADNSPLHRIC